MSEKKIGYDDAYSLKLSFYDEKLDEANVIKLRFIKFYY